MKCRLLVRDVFLQLTVFIETDNDGIADIAHEDCTKYIRTLF